MPRNKTVIGADVIAILTEWPEFKSLDLEKIQNLVNNKNIVDCRNLLNKQQALDLGYNYSCIGYNIPKVIKQSSKAA